MTEHTGAETADSSAVDSHARENDVPASLKGPVGGVEQSPTADAPLNGVEPGSASRTTTTGADLDPSQTQQGAALYPGEVVGELSLIHI